MRLIMSKLIRNMYSFLLLDKKYFDVFFVRQIARMLGKTDVPVEEDFNESWD